MARLWLIVLAACVCLSVQIMADSHDDDMKSDMMGDYMKKFLDMMKHEEMMKEKEMMKGKEIMKGGRKEREMEDGGEMRKEGGMDKGGGGGGSAQSGGLKLSINLDIGSLGQMLGAGQPPHKEEKKEMKNGMNEGMKEGHDGMKEGHDDMKEGHDGMKEGHDGMNEGNDGMNEGHDSMKEGHDGNKMDMLMKFMKEHFMQHENEKMKEKKKMEQKPCPKQPPVHVCKVNNTATKQVVQQGCPPGMKCGNPGAIFGNWTIHICRPMDYKGINGSARVMDGEGGGMPGNMDGEDGMRHPDPCPLEPYPFTCKLNASGVVWQQACPNNMTCSSDNKQNGNWTFNVCPSQWQKNFDDWKREKDMKMYYAWKREQSRRKEEEKRFMEWKHERMMREEEERRYQQHDEYKKWEERERMMKSSDDW